MKDVRQAQLISALRRGDERRRASRAKRLAMSPVATLWPVVARHFNLGRMLEVSTFFGRKMKVFIPEPVSVVIWRYGMFEADVCYYLLKLLRSGDTFIDIGGHFGFFSMLGSEMVGPDGVVVTFEPMPRARELLIDNLNNCAGPAQRHLVPVAAGDAKGKLFFKDFGLVGSAFATSMSERSNAVKLYGEVEVEVRRLDDVVRELGLELCRLIKVDAENAEYQVIQGGLQTLRKLRPAVILEAGDADGKAGATRRVLDLVVAQGYEPFEFDDFALKPHTLQATYTYGNYLMVPKELIASVTSNRSAPVA